MGSRRLVTVVSVVFALGLVLAACSSGNGSGGSSGSTGGSTGGSATATTGATGTTATTGSTGSSGGSSGGTTITIQNFSFVPGQLAVNGKATITVTNNDSVTHTFTADDGTFDEQVPAGQTISVKVNITKDTGYHCSIHPTMTGTLTAG
jgi:plastocyanin